MGRLVTADKINEKLATEEYVQGTITSGVNGLDIGTEVLVKAEDYIKSGKDSEIDIVVDTKKMRVRKAYVTLKSRIAEDGQSRLEKYLHKALIEEKKSITEAINEGIFGSIVGGLTGFALGKKIGETICKVLGVERGLLYDLFTSRVFSAAIGSAIGKQL
jgi:hypothetical protein